MRDSGIAYASRAMSESSDRKDDEIEEVVIPLDRVTIARLARLSRIVGDHPTSVAASLLHDILKDDELHNEIERSIAPPPGTPKH